MPTPDASIPNDHTSQKKTRCLVSVSYPSPRCYLPLQPNSPPAWPHSPPLFFARCHARTHECAARHASAAASRRARGVRVAIAFRGVLPRPASIELHRLPLCCLPCSSRLTKWTSQATASRARDAVPRYLAPIASSHGVSVLRPCVATASARISSAWQALWSDAMLSAACSARSCRGVCRPNASATGGGRSRRRNVPVAQACRRLLHVFFVLQPDVCFLCARLRLDGARAP